MADTQSSKKKQTLCHHTDKESAKKILQDRVIKQSDRSQGDAAFGPGTYLTTLNHDEPPIKVAVNNFDATIPSLAKKMQQGKTDAIIEITGIPNESVEKCSAGGRDVYRYPGDLNLSDAKAVDCYLRDEDGKAQKYTHK